MLCRIGSLEVVELVSYVRGLNLFKVNKVSIGVLMDGF